MSKKVIVVTGAAGFLGSSIVANLAGAYEILAIDMRPPGSDLRAVAPDIVWLQGDISNAESVASAFKKATDQFRQIDFVLHLAAYYHFGSDWRQEYTKTNIEGTENLVRAAVEYGVRRFIFASSIAATEPPAAGQLLTEHSATSHYVPYARSKAIGEDLIRRTEGKLKSAIIRFAGVFSDWCELPPLFSLIRLWTSAPIINRAMPGDGRSGIPYIHLKDAVRLVESCLDQDDRLGSHEILLASQHGTVLHKEIYNAVRRAASGQEPPKPIHIPPTLARFGLTAKVALEKTCARPSYQHPWMVEFIDRPWAVDTRETKQKLDWRCNPGLGILERIPIILERYAKQRKTWLDRNTRRNQARFLYTS